MRLINEFKQRITLSSLLANHAGRKVITHKDYNRLNELLPIINIIGSKPLEIPEVILTKDIVIRISNASIG